MSELRGRRRGRGRLTNAGRILRSHHHTDAAFRPYEQDSFNYDETTPIDSGEHPRPSRLEELRARKRDLELQILSEEIGREQRKQLPIMERDSRSSRRYDDGEVTRYGAGESYRPFNATARRARSPERERARSPPPRDQRERDRPRSPPPRERARSPVGHEDRYVPDRTPRRRSRSPGFRRDRSRGRDMRGPAADTWRRRDQSRSPGRRPSPRRSPIRRNSPPPRRFSPPRRDMRDDRDRRGFEARDPRSLPPSRSRSQQSDAFEPVSGGWGDDPNAVPVSNKRSFQLPERPHDMPSSDFRSPSRRFNTPRGARHISGQRQNDMRHPNPASSDHMRSDHATDFPHGYGPAHGRGQEPHYAPDLSPPSNYINTSHRGRSRSIERDRRDVRDRDRRSPPRRISPPGGRGNAFRRRSPSMDRRDDRFVGSYRRSSPPRDSAMSSALPSRDQSRRPSPTPAVVRRDDRSNVQSPRSPRHQSRSPQRAPPREKSPTRAPLDGPTTRSPPRGPAALRPPPTGPRGDRDRRDSRDARDTRNFSGPPASTTGPPSRPAPSPAPSRQGATSPGIPPSGPRGYGTPRGGYGRGGRGNSWTPTISSRNLPPAAGPASATTGSNNIPSGPRGHTPTSSSLPSTPVSQSKPFNPPKGPAAEKRQLSVFEREVATMTPIIPGGKMSLEDEAAMEGVLPEQLVSHRALKAEGERIRAEKEKTDERTRSLLAGWDKIMREVDLARLKTELTEEALAKSSGEGYTGSAF
ncbi:hypothetical protein JX266_003087 [Neoarthrinium moseri]|uniref:uncharacterized protein n=1 Tax=Neoarthrinium moseri TaxID=1658444 RepID=UPI001FDB35DF|nr:uncharacterized protein JN550_007223 [Neoarthrinium moseri]KAI1851625.1 hypothetical protein JX266_003087 [Neoarthrinium moseri]KAI1867171.1 hypothetical protein JN550_007223 [Neoarthrinium moseri]